MTDREQELSAALLWLRNHFETTARSSRFKQAVLKRIDQCLAEGGPVTGAIAIAFRERYPVSGLDDTG